MLWGALAAIATAVCWSFTAIFFSYSGRLVGSDVVNRSRLVFAFLFLLITHYFLEGTLFPIDAEPFRWFWLTISAILGLVLGDTFLFKAFVMVGPRMSTLLMSTVPLYSLFFGWFLFDEVVTAVEFTGVLITVAGIGWVVTEKQVGQNAGEKQRYKLGILFGLLGALGQVTNLVAARYGMVGDYSTVSASQIRIFVAMIILWGMTALRGQVGYTLRQWRHRQAFSAIVAGSFVGPFLGILFSLIAVQYARLGIASTLMALTPIILIPIEYILFRRRVSMRGIVGTAVAIAGIALIFLPT